MWEWASHLSSELDLPRLDENCWELNAYADGNAIRRRDVLLCLFAHIVVWHICEWCGGGVDIGVGGNGCLAQSKRDNRSESKMQNPIEIVCSHLKSTNCALHCVCATKTQYVCCADTFVDVKNIYMYMFGDRDWRQRNSISVNALEQTASLMPNWL